MTTEVLNLLIAILGPLFASVGDNEVWLKLIDNLPQIITSLGVIIVGWFAYKSRQQSATNEQKIDVVAKSVDGMKSELVNATAGRNLAEGQLMERDAERVYRAETTTEEDPIN